MSWLRPSPFEDALLADARDEWPEIIDLARVLTLVPRIEPLLLRNARQAFVPQAPVEIESMLWFSSLVIQRSTRNIVLHPGAARRLADELRVGGDRFPAFDRVWELTRRNTRHWPPEERLERDLRCHALTGAQAEIQKGLRDILRRIQKETEEEKRIELARWVKRTLPAVIARQQALDEAALLTQFAGLALGDSGDWTEFGQPQALPGWLSEKLPEPFHTSYLDVQIHGDHKAQVMNFLAAEENNDAIAFPTPLPARLHVAAEGQEGVWHSVKAGSRIAIDRPGRRIRLTTIDGQQYLLKADDLPEPPPVPEETLRQTQPKLYLTYVDSDLAQAQKLRDWLEASGYDIELISEQAAERRSESTPGEPVRLIRLWTRAAQEYWETKTVDAQASLEHSLILRTDRVELPLGGEGPGRRFDWLDWSALNESPGAEVLLARLRNWLSGESDDSPMPQPTGDELEHAEEIDSLLKEIDNPETEPPRRLEIGDRLAELGDPRPGVGVREVQVPDDSSVSGQPVESDAAEVVEAAFSPEVQRLLEEVYDIKTEPPRRLAIGDELDRPGDPRKGVGLDENGLPEIDWVEIPGGPFIYQYGETLELPTFYISRYPITNAQFQAFIDAGGYEDERWWKDLRRPEPNESEWKQSNRPRTDVDWYECVAFARWFSAQLGYTNEEIRLPTEQEWEKAARGTEGLIYPWGKAYKSGYANVNEKTTKVGPWYQEQTTAVGIYPHGHSPYGVEDMVGTVWEWCLNKYEQPKITTPDSNGDSRVLRGGSWVSLTGNARAGLRLRNGPDYRASNRGFRVLSSVPIAGR